MPKNIKKTIPTNIFLEMEKIMEATNKLGKKGELKATMINKTVSLALNSSKILFFRF
ncbi:hypothetical protein [Clostridium beijerinckii]|uniref:hypothetical protein n=1 Tax=Clostridium beijerinckii TaxID=1520 RepID=UPI0022E5D875|nr:hypothetical protein [Clostridium beijerinckii]